MAAMPGYRGARPAHWDWREGRRWAVAAVVVLLAHLAIPASLLMQPDVIEADMGSPAVLLELAPVPAGPVIPMPDLAPGPRQLQPPSVAREEITATTQPRPELPATKRVDLPEEADGEIPRPPDQPQPPEKPASVAPPQQASVETPQPTAPPPLTIQAAQAAGPALGRAPGPSSRVLATWQQTLVAQLQKFKRYPQAARGMKGVVVVSFALDRSGRVISSRIEQGSGSPMLDSEALALIKRAEPLPPPPRGIADDQLAFVIPINYVGGGR